MERISQRKHYDFDTMENFIRCKVYPESISDRGEMCNFRRGTYPHFFYDTVLSVTCFYKICGLPKVARLLKTFLPFHLEWKSFSKCKYKKITNFDRLTEMCLANRRM